MIIVRLLSPGPWLVGTTKVYSGVGADIVMESITLIAHRLSVGDLSVHSPPARSPKLKLVHLHIHLPPTKAHAFGFQSQPLLDCGVAAQFDLSARSQHSLPGQAKAASQDSCHLTRCSRQSRRSGNRAVRGHLTSGNAANRSLD